jgi:hypothetical protein
MKQFGKWMLATVFGATVVLTAALPAHAHITFEEKNDPQPDEENVMFQSTGTGTSITGLTNQNNIPVQFSSTAVIKPTANGQADIIANEGFLTNLIITVPGGTYQDLIIDPMTNLGNLQAAGGTADVSVTTNDGVFTHSYDLGSGNNFLTIFATDGESILSTSITMEGAGNFADLKQPRISGAALNGTPSATPEPCTLALLGLGALPLAGRLRRRRQA